MNIFIRIFLVLILANCSVGLDPCWFVGFRFGKIQSNCENEICSQIIRKPGSRKVFPASREIRGDPIRCVEAAEMMEMYFNMRGLSVDADRSLSMAESILEIRDAVDALSHAVVPAVRRMLFSMKPIDARILQIMQSIDETFLRHFTRSDSRDMLRSSIATSEGFRELQRFWAEVVKWSAYAPHAFDVETGLTAPFLHFNLDLISIMEGRVEIRPVEFRIYFLVVGFTHVGYRREFAAFEVSPIQRSNLRDPITVLKMAEAILRIAVDPTDTEATLYVALLIGRVTPYRGPSATELMLQRQFSIQVCPRLAHIFTLGHEFWRRNIKDAVSAIAYCRRSTPERGLKEASFSLIERKGGHDLLRNPILDALVNEVENSDFPWSDGFDPSVDGPDTIAFNIMKAYIARSTPFMSFGDMQLFRGSSSYESRTAFENAMRGLGKTIGLCIRYNGPCKELSPLPDAIVKAIFENYSPAYFTQALKLHKRSFGNSLSIEHNIEMFIYEPIFFMRIGIRHSLGPGGIYATNPDRPSWTVL